MKKWMMFVDGENLIAGAQKLADASRLRLVEGDFFRRDSLVWYPRRDAIIRPPIASIELELEPRSIRSYFYATAVQNDIRPVREALRKIGFEPRVFQRRLRRDEQVTKGLDIALATDLLSNAFSANFETALLIAGDADYVPLVEQVKRLGQRVLVASFASRISEELRLESDRYYELDESFPPAWSQFVATLPSPDSGLST